MEFVQSQMILDDVIIPLLTGYDVLALDIETRGRDFFKSAILLVQLATREEIYVLDARKLDLTHLLRVLEEANPLIIGHNLIYDLRFLMRDYNYNPGRLFDTMVAFWILNNGLEKPYISLRDLLRRHLNITIDKDIRKSFQTTYGDLSDEQIKYAAIDVEHLIAIMEIQVQRLEAANLIDTARLEFRVLTATARLEMNGIKLDVDKWAEAPGRLTEEMVVHELAVAGILGDVPTQGAFFTSPRPMIPNLRSSKQVTRMLADLGIPVTSTRKELLAKVEHPIARHIIEYRRLDKLRSTYGRNFLNLVASDGRIHANFHQVGTQTGRFSSSKPNMQNIPRDPFYRSCFIAEEGNMLLAADYSQIELRIAALMSGDQVMLDEYRKGNADLHRLTAVKIYHTEDITPDQRQKGKNTNFGIIYKITEHGLYLRFDIPISEGRFLLKESRGVYPTLFAYMDKEADLAIAQGFNTTKIGRRRYYELPSIGSRDFHKKLHRIRREASNLTIQGTAADVLKTALADLDLELRHRGAFIVNTVHDEIVVETPKAEVSETLGILYNTMSDAARSVLGDGLEWKVDASVGVYWKKS